MTSPPPARSAAESLVRNATMARTYSLPTTRPAVGALSRNSAGRRRTAPCDRLRAGGTALRRGRRLKTLWGTGAQFGHRAVVRVPPGKRVPPRHARTRRACYRRRDSDIASRWSTCAGTARCGRARRRESGGCRARESDIASGQSLRDRACERRVRAGDLAAHGLVIGAGHSDPARRPRRLTQRSGPLQHRRAHSRSASRVAASWRSWVSWPSVNQP
jgi:hypothetical protein